MTEEVKMSYQIKPFWKSVNAILDKVHTALEVYPDHITDAVTMTAVELVENAIKYGSKGNHNHMIDFNLNIVEQVITIEVINSFGSMDDCTTLITHIDKIRLASDPRQLYGNRLKELLKGQSPASPSQIGLYRIASEGGFSLAYKIEDPLVTIIATRLLIDNERE